MVFSDSGDEDLDLALAQPVHHADDDVTETSEGYDRLSPLLKRGASVTSLSEKDTPPPKKRSRPTIVDPEKIQWSSEASANEGEEAYKKFVARKTVARSKAQKSAQRARANDSDHDRPANKTRDKTATTGVGKRVTKKRIKQRNYDEPTSDEDLMEWTVPDYLQERRKKFERRRELLKQGGLSLPPSFDDIPFSDDERLKYLKERPDFPHGKTYAPYKDIELPYSLGLIPAPIAQFLRDYQVKGAAFLHELFVYQKGGVLGDDMGLGKTIQVIAFLTAAYAKTGDERDQKRMRKLNRKGRKYLRTLIICPGSLMANWQDELRRWGWWQVEVFHGDNKQKADALSQAQSGRLEIMITTYDTYRQRASEINLIQWDCVIADECHKIKERKTAITKVMNDVNALCRIGLTGTAIQNKYEELWTLLNWTNPGRFGPISTWKHTICEPLKLGQSHNASVQELARGRQTAKLLVQNLLPQFFLRRMKTLIKDQLPKKSDRVVFCPLTSTQAAAYQNFLDSDIVGHIKESSRICQCGSGRKSGWCCKMLLEDGSRWQNWVFPAITTLQKIANHLANLIPHSNDPAEKQAKDLDMLQIALPTDWRRLYQNRDSMLHTGNPEFCGKWRVLKKLLKFWHDEGENKVLVFSHSVRLLKMLQDLFINTSYNVKFLDGSMSYDDRYAAVQDFNTDPTQFVFLISTKAGGVGLNITSANKVVVVDPNWNPSYDLQAQDRAYRIGQTRDVEVFRLVSQGTLEEIVYARQIYKQQQANIGYNASTERRYFQGVQDRTDQKGEIFGLKNLFSYENENVVLRDIVHKLNVAESKADVRIARLELEDRETSQSPSDDGDEKDDVQRSFKNEHDREDAMMSQLAAEIIGEEVKQGKTRSRGKATSFTGSAADGTEKKHDPIQAILSSVGVTYTHENSEVIGSSRVEEQLSKRAAQSTAAEKNNKSADWDPQMQQARVFLEESQTQSPRKLRKHRQSSQIPSSPTKLRPKWEDAKGNIRYIYRPPDDVKRRQFGSLARWAEYGDDVVGFALVVENWTQAQRRECLEKFYRWRREILEETPKSEVELSEGDFSAIERTDEDMCSTAATCLTSNPDKKSGLHDHNTAGIHSASADEVAGHNHRTDMTEQSKCGAIVIDEDDDDEDDEL